MGKQSRWPSFLATYNSYGSCKPVAETNHHGGTEERESGERTEKMTATLQTELHVCAMCVVEYVDQQSAFTANSALIEHKLTHHHYHHHFG